MLSPTSTQLTQLTKHWKEHGASVSGVVATEEEIVEWEQKNAIRAPDDLKNYLLGVNGMSLTAHGEMDDDFFRFLPLSQMKPEIEISTSGRAGRFVFVDYLQLCYWYCVELDSTERETTRVFLGGTSKPEEARLVASSLSEFFQLYMENQRSLEIIPIKDAY
jgi:hypothetical protein